MAITLITTPGDPDANSYVSLTEAENYFAGRLNNSLWELNSSSLPRALITATRRIDTERFSGIRETRSQALQFPRSLIYDADGYPYDANTIPRNLKNAVCELAYFYLQQNERLVSEVELHDAQFLSDYKVGPLSYSFKGDGNNVLPNSVKAELKAIGANTWLGDSYVEEIYR